MRRDQYGKTNLFAEKELRQFLDARKQYVLSSIEDERDDYILNVNEEDFIRYKKTEAQVEQLEIHIDQIYASSSEQMIPAEYFPGTFHVRRGQSYKKDVIKFHIPFTGNRDLLSYMPSSRLMWSMEIKVDDAEFTFEVINFSDNSSAIVREKDSSTNNIMRQLKNVQQEVELHNSCLEHHIRSALDAKKKRVMAKSGVLASLGVPIKKTSSPPETFAVPAKTKNKRVVISKPLVKEDKFIPEPTLDNQTYNQILQVIHDIGKEFERLPSLYANKEEEHLRDHFLMLLEPNFEGSATGETFNKTGKTDILLRHEGTNIFIGECKFWKGKKSFLNTISQLLGYLTWRDSKAAVIMFVPNINFTSIIQTAKDSLPEHENYLRFVKERDETWFDCEFHLNGDRNRIVKIAIMLYHTPRNS